MATRRLDWLARIGLDSVDRESFGAIEVWTAHVEFTPWRGAKPGHHEMDCRKGDNLVMASDGSMSCAELEIARAFRETGWSAFWMSTCGRSNRAWRPFMAVARQPRVSRVEPLELLPASIARTANAGGTTGIPDVVTWDPRDARPYFVEAKGPGDKGIAQVPWIDRARQSKAIGYDDVVRLVWTFR